MNLSPAAELAVRGILVLAENHGGPPVTLETICKARDLSRQYLVKIFSSLTRAGLVIAVRGKKGGYLLSRSPGDISVLEVIEAVEGPVALNFCQHTPPRCDQEDCRLRQVWTELQDTFKRTLSSVSLGQCVGPGAGSE